jgi:predicted nucleotidyltransferase
VDTASLLRSLKARNVRYVVIGAAAFPVHGYARATLDIDIFIEPTRENASRARDGSIGGASASFASLEDLIVMKRAAGRRKDGEDLRVLLEIQKRRGGEG